MVPHLQVLRNVTVAEHQGLMDILCHLHLCTTAKGTQEVVSLLAGVAGLETDFEVCEKWVYFNRLSLVDVLC